MTQLAIRSFRPGDEEPLGTLWRRVFPDDPPWNAPEVMIENKLKVQPELLLVGEIAGSIVGAVIAGFDGVRGWLYHLAVSPEHRRRGFATALVRAAEQGLGDLGCTKVNLQVRATNPEVVAFYRSVGYQTEDRVSMGRRLETFSIELDRTIGAPRGFAWRVWTEPEHLKRWYRPDDSWSTPVAEIDLRVGGQYRIGLTPPNASTFYEVGTYLTVNVPELLVYTVRFEGTHPRFEGAHLDSPTGEEMETYETRITVRFQPMPRDETRVLVKQEGYRSEEDRDRHREGWPRFLDHFVRYCETASRTRA